MPFEDFVVSLDFVARTRFSGENPDRMPTLKTLGGMKSWSLKWMRVAWKARASGVVTHRGATSRELGGGYRDDVPAGKSVAQMPRIPERHTLHRYTTDRPGKHRMADSRETLGSPMQHTPQQHLGGGLAQWGAGGSALESSSWIACYANRRTRGSCVYF